MPVFITGFAAIFTSLFGWGLAAEFSWLRYEPGGVPQLLVAMVVVPVLAAWAAAELVNLASPRRVFDPRRGIRVSRLLLGVVAGGLSAVAGAALLPLADRFVPDALVFGGASALMAGAIVLTCPRTRPGHCIHCGYDLRQSPSPGQPGAGRCAECGADIVAPPGPSRVGRALRVEVP